MCQLYQAELPLRIPLPAWFQRLAGGKRVWREVAVMLWPMPAISETLTCRGWRWHSGLWLLRCHAVLPQLLQPRGQVCAQKHNQGSDFWGVLDCQGQRQPAFHPSSQPAAHTCGIHFVLALFHLTATFPSQCLMSCGIQPPGDLPDSDRTRGLLPCRWILLLSEPMGLPIYPKRGDISAENEEQGLLFT